MYLARLRLLAILIWSVVASTVLSADPSDKAKTSQQLEAAVNQLVAALPNWRVHRIDERPSVEVDGQKGYRVVLRTSWKEPPPGAFPQQVTQPQPGDDYVHRHSDWHFVLFPSSNAKLSAEAKRAI